MTTMLGLRTLGLLVLSVAVIQAMEMDISDDLPTPMEIHQMRARKVSQVKRMIEPKTDSTLQQVYGGNEGNASFPFLVYIESFTSDGVLVHQCTGSILNTTWVLTAAQCFERANFSVMYYGDPSRDSATAKKCNISSSAAVVHEKFIYNGLENDIALINLTAASCVLTFAANVQAVPICCPSFFKPKNVMYNSTIKVTAFGYGRIEDVPPDSDCPVPEGPASVFSYAQIPMGNSSAFCAAQLRQYYLKLASTQVCSNGLLNRTTGAFGPGDSGGPIVVTAPASASNTGLANTVKGMCVAGIISLHNYETYFNTFPFTMTDIQGQIKWLQGKMKTKDLKC